MNKTTQITVGIIILAVAALGYFIFMQQPDQNTATTTSLSPVSAPSSDRAAVLVFPHAGSSLEEQAKHDQLVKNLAQDAGYLSINACKPNPLVMHVSLKNDFVIKNDDATEHSLTLGFETIRIPSHGSLPVKPSQLFHGAAGNHGYRCDSATSLAGVFQVTP